MDRAGAVYGLFHPIALPERARGHASSSAMFRALL